MLTCAAGVKAAIKYMQAAGLAAMRETVRDNTRGYRIVDVNLWRANELKTVR